MAALSGSVIGGLSVTTSSDADALSATHLRYSRPCARRQCSARRRFASRQALLASARIAASSATAVSVASLLVESGYADDLVCTAARF